MGALLRCGVQASHCGGFSCCGARALGTRASVVAAGGLSSCSAWALGHAYSAVGAHGLSCSVACGIFPDQGSNPCPLHWQADSFFFFGRRILNHCTTREFQKEIFESIYFIPFLHWVPCILCHLLVMMCFFLSVSRKTTIKCEYSSYNISHLPAT